MGLQSLEGMLEVADVDRALLWHLQSNHYPPVPKSMIPVCKEAIDAANRGLWDDEIDLPDGVLYRGDSYAPVKAIIEQHHLGSFLSGDDND